MVWVVKLVQNIRLHKKNGITHEVQKRKQPHTHRPRLEPLSSQRMQDSRTLQVETHEKKYMAV